MEGAAVLGGLEWQRAQVVGVHDETPRVRTLLLDVEGWIGHRPGQHVDVRLTAEDGYQAHRAYSIASAPNAGSLAITVERLEDGEVSPYLTKEARLGDSLEVRGPLGRYFVWDVSCGGPILLLAGGSGVVPLIGMLRHRAHYMPRVPARLLYSARSLRDVIYRDELAGLAAADPDLVVRNTLTRVAPPGWTGWARRVDLAMIQEIAWPVAAQPLAYCCGPSGFVETAATALEDLCYPRDRVRTERFGPSGT